MSDETSGGNVPLTNTQKPQQIKEKLVIKPDDIKLNVEPEIIKPNIKELHERIKKENKPKRKYTKDPNKKYGYARSKTKKLPVQSSIIKQNVQSVGVKKLEKKSGNVGFYAGVTIGIIAVIVGGYYIYRKYKEWKDTTDETKMVKSILDQNAKEIKERDGT